MYNFKMKLFLYFTVTVWGQVLIYLKVVVSKPNKSYKQLQKGQLSLPEHY